MLMYDKTQLNLYALSAFWAGMTGGIAVSFFEPVVTNSILFSIAVPYMIYLYCVAKKTKEEMNNV